MNMLLEILCGIVLIGGIVTLCGIFLYAVHGIEENHKIRCEILKMRKEILDEERNKL